MRRPIDYEIIYKKKKGKLVRIYRPIYEELGNARAVFKRKPLKDQ